MYDLPLEEKDNSYFYFESFNSLMNKLFFLSELREALWLQGGKLELWLTLPLDPRSSWFTVLSLFSIHTYWFGQKQAEVQRVAKD